MLNKSAIKRNKIKSFIETIKKENDSDEVIKALNEIENYLDEKKYGLVWEKHEELVDIQMKNNIPVFTEVVSNKIVDLPEEDFNFLLEGDNLHSLNLLQKTHKGKIDIIYIDPPYNTHNSLTYDDARIGEDDAFRHSMWLSFMSERLQRAKTLLSQQGIIFISIDDNEGYNLKVLCDEIFDEENFMGSFSVTKAEGGGQAKFLVKGHDMVLVYSSNLSTAKPLGRPKDVRGKTFEKEGEMFWIQEDAYRKVFGKYGNLHYEEILEYRDEEFKKEIDKKIETGEVILLDKGLNGMKIIGKVRKLSDDYSKYHSVLKQLNSNGKSELAGFGLDDLFDYPKPVSLIKELVSGAAFLRPGKLTVLDFFAGSGTTGQAVLELIKETGRDFNFILCTNNEVSSKQKLRFVQSLGYIQNYNPGVQTTDSAIENRIAKELEKIGKSLESLIKENKEHYESFGICQSVTLPRLQKTISGFEWQKKFMKTLFKKKLTEKTLPKMNDYLEEINRIKETENYGKYKIRVDDMSNLILEAEVKAGEKYKGIPANLKYFKTDFVSKENPEINSVSEQLLDHLKEMVELEFFIDLDNSSKVQLITSESELDLFFEGEKNCDKVLFLPTFVLMKGSQEYLAKQRNITIIKVPDYYFMKELREVGEL